MNVISIIMLVFALLGALDRMFGNKFGIGKEFEKGFLILGRLVLSMMGMIIIAPILAELLSPAFDFVYNIFKIDPSIIPASLFANDMGGAPLAKEIAKNSEIGMYNAMIVSSMMGATISFSIPLAFGSVKKEKQKDMILGLLCGIVTMPFGCVIAGFICKIPILSLLFNLLPLFILAAVMAVGLVFFPNACIKIFNVLGILINLMITFGLVLGIIEILMGVKPIESADSALEAAYICLNAAVVMSGAFPLLFILSKLLSKPIGALGRVLGINEISAMGFISSLSTNISTFEMMNEMDEKGTVLNSAFLMSASFTFAGHLAFTLAFAPSYLLPMMVAKITAGVAAVLFALFMYNRASSKTTKGAC